MALSGWRLQSQNIHLWQCWYHALGLEALTRFSQHWKSRGICLLYPPYYLLNLGSVSNLLQSADIAVLLTKTLAGSICGMAGMLGPGSGEPIAWVAKECAGGQQGVNSIDIMNFGHEAGRKTGPSSGPHSVGRYKLWYVSKLQKWLGQGSGPDSKPRKMSIELHPWLWRNVYFLSISTCRVQCNPVLINYLYHLNQK